MPDKNNKHGAHKARAFSNSDEDAGDTSPGASQKTLYRLDRVSPYETRIAAENNFRDISRSHVSTLLREIDTQIYKHERDVIITASRFVSIVRDATSHCIVASFQIVGRPIFEHDLDDTDSLDVTALRAQLKRERR